MPSASRTSAKPPPPKPELSGSTTDSISDDVFASLAATFPGQDWAKLATLMDGRVARHGLRRAAEMREAAQMLAELGLSPSLSEAIADAHERRVLQPPAD